MKSRLAVVALVTVTGMILMLSKLERQMVFFPSVYPEGDWQPASLPFEDVWFETEDGIKLHGWWVGHDQAKFNLLFCHGNAGNLTDRIAAIQALRQHLDANILIFDYRGYGRSEGAPDGRGIQLDGEAAFAQLEKRKPPLPRVVLGRSLGGAVATHIASLHRPDALILENTFSSLPDVAKVHYPWLPARLVMKHPQDSWKKITNYKGPLFQSHGTLDDIVPYEIGKRLHAAANDPKQWFPLTGMGHNDMGSPEYYAAMRHFVEQSLGL